MVIYITNNKNQTINFDFSQNLSGKTGIFYLKKNNNIVIQQNLIPIDEVNGLYKIDLTDNTTNIDLGIYNYECIFNGGVGIVEQDDAYLIENEEKRIKYIKDTYKLIFDYNTIKKAFNNAIKKLIKHHYNKGKDINYSTNENNGEYFIEIDNYVADNKNYGFICKDSIRIYEYSLKPPYTVTELNNHITKILFDYPTGKTIIYMDNKYPSDNCLLKIDYNKTSKKFSEIYDKIKYIQELYTYLYLLDHTEINKLQLGFTSKSINGVTFDYDKASIDDLKIKIRQWIDNEAEEFEEIIIKNVVLSNNY